MIDELIDVSVYGANPGDQMVLSNYMYAEDSSWEAPDFPYLMIILGHTHTLYPLLQALGHERATKAPVGSALFFSVATLPGSDEYYIGVTNYENESDVSNLVFDCSLPELDNYCTAAEF